MSSKTICDAIDEIVVPLVTEYGPDTHYILLDNARPHTSSATREHMSQLGLNWV